VSSPLPLPTLLSQPLVAYTIELDHLFETRMPHRTAESRRSGGAPDGPLLTSYAMWANFLRHADDGRTLREVREAAFITSKTLHVVGAGMERWGYVTVGPGKGEDRPISLTAGGRLARSTWAPLPDEVDGRWRERYGELARPLADVLPPESSFPRFLPVARYEAGLRAEIADDREAAAPATDLSVGELLAQVLLAFTVEYEAESDLSLAEAAVFLRVLSAEAVPVREVPRATGVSKEAVAFGTKFLARRGLAEVTAGAGGHVTLTNAGLEAKERHGALLAEVERRWRKRLGTPLDAVRALLEGLVGDGTLASSPLAAAVTPPPGTWRAKREQPALLPHHPLVLHRGGYPDGS
jgi:hypothetical protein